MSPKGRWIPAADTCVYCGFPVRHWTKTCPAHRDLVRIDDHRLLDDEFRWALVSEADALDSPRDRAGTADLRRNEDLLDDQGS